MFNLPWPAHAPPNRNGQLGLLPSAAVFFSAFTICCCSVRPEVLDIIQLETGKARRHAFEEVLDTAIVAALLRAARRRDAASTPPPRRRATC